MAVAEKKLVSSSFSDFSGGVNSVEAAIQIAPNQVHPDTIGCMLKKSGIVKYPGSLGLSATTTFSTYLRSLFIHRQLDTTENLYGLSNGVLSLIDKSTGGLTTKYTMGGEAGEGWHCEAFGKAWVSNGTSTVKIEGTTAYKVGISAPAGGITIGYEGSAGSLPDGAYEIYFSYTRKVSGVTKLYSKGYLIGTQILGAGGIGSGHNQIGLGNIPYSADPQVTHLTFWVKSPGEVVHYLFHEIANNVIGTTTSTFIPDTTGKNTTLVYEVNAVDNGEPPANSFIYSFANRIWLIKDNIIYYSQKAYNEYDLEIFPAANYRITPYKLTGIFSVGQNLYFNTESGILMLPGGDTSAQDYLIEPRWHFEYMRTVDRWNNGVIGLTNDGVRYFDGAQFTNYDMGYSIKDRIHGAYNASANYQPCGFIYRRDIRNEYHLMFCANTGNGTNDTHLILNLDTAFYNNAEENKFCWERQYISGNYAAVSRNDNTLFIGQQKSTAPKIFKEDTASNNTINAYGPDGILITAATAYPMKLRTKEILFDITARFKGIKYYLLAYNEKAYSIRFFVGTENGKTTPPLSIPSATETAAQWDVAEWDNAYFSGDQPAPFRGFFHDDFNGQTLYAEITQTDNDPDFRLLDIRIIGELEKGNFI